jgi:hypothetical protein
MTSSSDAWVVFSEQSGTSVMTLCERLNEWAQKDTEYNIHHAVDECVPVKDITR